MTPEVQKYFSDLRRPVGAINSPTPEEQVARIKAQKEVSSLNTSPKVPEQSWGERYFPFLSSQFKRVGDPVEEIKKDYEKAGVGGVIGGIVGRGVEGAKGALDKPAGDLPANVATGFTTNVNTSTTPTANPNTIPPPTAKVTPGISVGDSGFTVTGANTSGRPGYSNRTYFDSKGNEVASGLSSATNRGGFVGASTDAEAARNLQDRFAQDQAASAMAANFDRQTEALKSLRAAQMGIPRSALEPGANAQPEQQTVNPFARPGDSFGDDVFRKNALESAITDPTATKRQRSDAVEMFKAYMEGAQPQQRPQPRPVNPLDEQRFLLEQQRAGRQQLMDASRLAIDAANLQNNQAKTALEQKQYEDKVRADFIANATFTTPNVPTGQLAAIAIDVAKATGLPPDVALSYVDKAAAQFDWKNGPPKNIMDIGTLATTLAAAERRGQ